jgi:protein-S-isoprenylcysteine O-methyltransferase Ste14
MKNLGGLRIPLVLGETVRKGFTLLVPSIALSGFAFGLPLATTDNFFDLLRNFPTVAFMLVFTSWLWVEASFANHQSAITQRERLWRLAFAIMIYGGLLITLLEFARGPRETNLILTCIGLLLAVLGVLLRFTAINALGKFFTYELRVDPEQQLIQGGPYRYVRHPGYAGVLLLLAGLPLIFQNWYGFIWLGVVCSSFMLVRVPQEESLLLEAFGDLYREYMKRTKRFIPFIY